MLRTIVMLKRLERYVVFDLEKFIAVTRKPAGYARLALHRLEKQGLIFRVERNKYTMHIDPLLIASHLTWPSYLSFWTALRWHNLTEQIPQDVWVVTPRKRKKRQIIFNSTKINFVTVNKKYFFGFNKYAYEGFELFIAEPEKAIVDSLLFRKISWPEISEIIKLHKQDLSMRKLLHYANKTKNQKVLRMVMELK